MWATFQREYLPEDPPVRCSPTRLTTRDDGATVTAQLLVDGEHTTVTGEGNGPIAAFVHALQSDLGIDVEVVDYAEHAVTAGTDAQAVAYVEARSDDGIRWGVGMDETSHGVAQGRARRGQPVAHDRLTNLCAVHNGSSTQILLRRRQ